MINKDYLTGKIKTVFGNKITDIENWEEALESEEMYVPHHVLEWKYTKEELKQMNRYDVVPPEELIWMLRKAHNSNRFLHKGNDNKIKQQTGRNLCNHSLSSRIQTSETERIPGGFTDKFVNHFNMNPWDDTKLYKREKKFYYTHNKVCRWEL